MPKLIKITLWTIFTLFFAALLVFLAAVLLFDPNDYKDKLASAASEKLGHTIQIKGDIEASYFPWIALKAHEVTVLSSTPLKEKSLAEIGTLSFKVETLPLLKRAVKLDKITLEKASIYLVRSAQGQTNWAPKESGAPVQTEEPTPATSDATKPDKALQFEISGIEISNSDILYEDKKSKDRFHFQDVHLNTQAIKPNQTSPIEGRFTLEMIQSGKKVQNTSQFSGQLNFSAKQFELSDVNITLDLKGDGLPKSPMKASLKGDLLGDLMKAQLSFNDMILKVDDSTAKGTAQYRWTQQPNVTFDVHVDTLQADHYIAARTAPQTLAVAPTPPESPFKHVAYQPAHGLSYQGNLTLDTLKAQGLTLSQLQLTAQSDAKGVLLKPLKATLYQGTFEGQSLVNLSNNSTTLKGKLQSINMASLMKALGQDPMLSGRGFVEADLLINPKGLNGIAKVNIQEGYIEGVDLDYYLELARATLKNAPKPTGDRKRTDYNSITGTFRANQNQLSNNDLRVNANDFYALGEGQVNLNAQTLDYKFIVHRIYHDGAEHPNALPVAVRVQGPFSKPNVTPDIDEYVKTILEREGKEALKKQLDKQADKLLGNGAQEGGSSQSIEDKVEDKIGKELEKGIKKLFR